ncbi:MAG: beta-galactosidase, partial [Candidatus Hydrogenedentes bacterium]|nr:beta-galactosidase [Candidatus Hydrogenedentota bacterium]
MLLLASLYSVAVAAAPPEARIISGDKGAPAIVIDGHVNAPVLYSGNSLSGDEETVAEGIRLAGDADVDLFGVSVALPWITSDEETLASLDRLASANISGYYLLRISLAASGEWLDAHPDECLTTAEGTRLPYASPASTAWRNEAREQLLRRLKLVLDSKHGNRLFGVAFENLQNGAWAYPDAGSLLDYSPANLAAFREWLRREYRREKALRKAWNRSDLAFDSVLLPAPEERRAADFGIFPDAALRQPVLDLLRFQNGLIPETIAFFARAVKEATESRTLTAVSYGHTLEQPLGAGPTMADSGHVALARLLRSDVLDIVLAPHARFERGPGEPGHLSLPIESVTLHRKLPLVDDDTCTHLAVPSRNRDDGSPCVGPADTMEETQAIVRRNYGTFLTHRAGFVFYDPVPDGRWNDSDFWDSKMLLRRMAAELRSQAPFQPEVAFVVSEDAALHLAAAGNALCDESITRWRAPLDRLGTPVGYYLQSDAEWLPPTIRLLILANAYVLDKATQRAAERILDRGGTVIYTYAPDIAGGESPDVNRVSRAVGMKLTAHFDTAPIAIEEVTGTTVRLAGGWSPRFSIAAEGGEVLGRYLDTGDAAIFARPQGKGAIVYTAVPGLSATLLREICRRSGLRYYQQQQA